MNKLKDCPKVQEFIARLMVEYLINSVNAPGGFLMYQDVRTMISEGEVALVEDGENAILHISYKKPAVCSGFGGRAGHVPYFLNIVMKRRRHHHQQWWHTETWTGSLEFKK